MMRINDYFYFFFINLFFISTTTYSQNFDETWKEFLENNKISNMSELIRPDKVAEQSDYAKYLLMNTNSNFCQSDVEDAEELLTEVQAIDTRVHKSIPGFITKMNDLDTKIKAYHSIDAIWTKYLDTKEVDYEALEAVEGAKTLCEKKTLTKYSYMTAYHHFCQGDVSKSKNIFENRTLRLTEKTSLRIQDVEGMAPEVANMKTLFQGISKLDVAWKTYVKTGVSPGFDTELPLLICNPIPNMKEYVLRGATDICGLAPEMLEKVKELQEESGVAPDRQLAKKIKELEAAIQKKEENLVALNAAWLAFIPENKVSRKNKYGYDYCDNEALIRAYIMDGFVFVCDLAEENLQKIDSLQNNESTILEDVTMSKINELAELYQLYQANGRKIERIWTGFVAQGDVLSEDYQSTDLYCDHIQEVKDWTMKGLSGDCAEGYQYLEKIEALNRTFEFQFYEELECRVQRLRINIWECRYQAIQELARLESEEDTYEETLEKMMKENRMGDRPELCASEQ